MTIVRRVSPLGELVSLRQATPTAEPATPSGV